MRLIADLGDRAPLLLLLPGLTADAVAGRAGDVGAATTLGSPAGLSLNCGNGSSIVGFTAFAGVLAVEKLAFGDPHVGGFSIEFCRLAIARLSTVLPARLLSFVLPGEAKPTPPLKLLRTPAVVLGRLLLGLPSNEVPASRLDDTPGPMVLAAPPSTDLAAFATSCSFLMILSRSSQELMPAPPNTLLPSTCASTSVAPRLRYTATPSALPELPSGRPVSSRAW